MPRADRTSRRLDEDWIEVTVEDEHIRIDGVGEAVDDVIGPMVNRVVEVQVSRDSRGRHFLDIGAAISLVQVSDSARTAS